MQEKALIASVLAGDAAAERELYNAHVDRVFRLAYRMSGDRTMAEDFTQETFVRAFDHLPGFRGQASFATWLYSIAMSVVLNGLRKVKRYRQWELDWDEVAQRAPAKDAQDPELKLRLHRAIGGLSERLRAVFLMYDVEGYRHGEIAAILDIPEGTSKARLARAREQLRRALMSPAVRSAGREGR